MSGKLYIPNLEKQRWEEMEPLKRGGGWALCSAALVGDYLGGAGQLVADAVTW